MLRLVRSIHWIAMPFFAVDSAVEPQNDTFGRASMRAFAVEAVAFAAQAKAFVQGNSACF